MSSFNVRDLVFGEPKEGEMSDGTSFKKIPIKILRPDGTTDPLYVTTDTCFSFGIKKDHKYGGYSIPLILINRYSSTEKQRKFVKLMKDIMSVCHPTPKSCLYGEKNPMMYVKLDYDNEYHDILTYTYERNTMEDKESTKEINPEKYIGKKSCLAKVLIEIKGVFVGKTTTLQMRAKKIIFCDSKKRILNAL